MPTAINALGASDAAAVKAYVVQVGTAGVGADWRKTTSPNDSAFTASPGAVQACEWRDSISNWNSTDGTYGSTQTFANSGRAIGFNVKAAEIGQEFRTDTAKHGLGIFIDSNHVTAFGQTSEFAIRFRNAGGLAHFEALRFVFGNASTDPLQPPGEFLQDARIGVSGVRGARGLDFLGWTSGGTMGRSSGAFNADVFVASIRQNEYLQYYDDGTNYPFINMRIRQVSRFNVDLDIGRGDASDPSPNNWDTASDAPDSFISFGSRPFTGTNPNAACMVLGLARDGDSKRPFSFGSSPGILQIYTGNAVNGTVGLKIRGGGRTATANAANLVEIQSNTGFGATGATEYSWLVDGRLQLSATQLVGVGGNAFTPNWQIPGGGAPGELRPSWLKVLNSGGSTIFIPGWIN